MTNLLEPTWPEADVYLVWICFNHNCYHCWFQYSSGYSIFWHMLFLSLTHTSHKWLLVVFLNTLTQYCELLQLTNLPRADCKLLIDKINCTIDLLAHAILRAVAMLLALAMLLTLANWLAHTIPLPHTVQLTPFTLVCGIENTRVMRVLASRSHLLVNMHLSRTIHVKTKYGYKSAMY